MIRINLLGVERKAAKAPAFDIGRRITLASSSILVLAGLGIGWWYYSLTRESARVDTEIAAAQQEAARLQSLLAEVKDFEGRRAQLQQRVALIEQLRSGQSVPVQLLDHVSRSLPDMMWLTSMEQQGNEVTIEGESTTLIALSDFVGNLGSGTLLQKPIEIVNSQVETAAGGGGAPAGTTGGGIELIKFTVKAQIVPPARPGAGARGAAPPVPAAGAPAAR